MTARIDDQRVAVLYAGGWTQAEVAAKVGCARTTVTRSLHRSGLTGARRKGPAPVYGYDRRFFDVVTPESAYWAGFLAADGCVRADRDTVSVRLQLTDHDHVLKFCEAVRYDGSVRTTPSAACVHVNGPEWVGALRANFGIGPQKSKTLRFPTLPAAAVPAFVRGLVDGDGSVTMTTVPTLSLAGTTAVLTAVAEIAYCECGVRLKSGNRIPPVGLHSNGQTGQVSWSGRNAGLILAWLYAQSAEATRLTRKYDKYLALWPEGAGATDAKP